MNYLFEPHSKLVSDPSHLPLIHRESIGCHLHKIPDLTNIYFYMEDDHFIMNSNIFDIDDKGYLLRSTILIALVEYVSS